MELTKEQIKYIDHRLESEGIKYWDIRIEMLDHVVSDIEQKLQPEDSKFDFHQIVQESFIALGWEENFNGGGFEKIFLSRLRIYYHDDGSEKVYPMDEETYTLYIGTNPEFNTTDSGKARNLRASHLS